MTSKLASRIKKLEQRIRPDLEDQRRARDRPEKRPMDLEGLREEIRRDQEEN